MFGGLLQGLQAISDPAGEYMDLHSGTGRDWTLIAVICWIMIIAVGVVITGLNRRRRAVTSLDGAHEVSALWIFRWVVTITVVMLTADVILNGLPDHGYHSSYINGVEFQWRLDYHAKVGFLLLTAALALAQVALVWLTHLGNRRRAAIASEIVVWVPLGLAVHWSDPVETSCIRLGTDRPGCISNTIGSSSAGWIVASLIIGIVVGLVWSICSPQQEDADDRPVTLAYRSAEEP